jgi:hypothetical protein
MRRLPLPTVDFDTPDSHPSARTRSPTFRVDVSGDVGGHDHRPQRPIHPTARLEQRREEAALTHLGDADLVPSRCRHQPVPPAVALPGAGLGALVASGTDRSGQLLLDQALQRVADHLAQQVLDPLTGLASEHLGQG